MTQPGADAARRFYKSVTVALEDAGHAVKLDGRGPRSPGGKRLVLPTEALAQLIADEWSAQGAHILPAAMPATRLAFTAIDRVSQARDEVAAQVADYAGHDLICYFADAPQTLAERETKAWEPMLDWARDELGLPLQRTVGIVHRPQPPEVKDKTHALCLAEDDFALTAIAHATPLFGSAVLALALRRGRLSGMEAFTLSQVDERFQVEQWGEDEEAAARTKALEAETVVLERWFRSLG